MVVTNHTPQADQEVAAFPHRSGEEVFSDLVAAYDQSINRSIDWNADTFRLLVSAILDVAHLTDSSLDADEARRENARRAYAKGLPQMESGRVAFDPAPTSESIAVALVAELKRQGLTSPVSPESVAPFTNPKRLDTPDESIPESVTVPASDNAEWDSRVAESVPAPDTSYEAWLRQHRNEPSGSDADKLP